MAANRMQDDPNAVDALWDNETQLDQLAREAVQQALQEHKRNGQSVVVWQDGRIVTLTPEQIPPLRIPRPPHNPPHSPRRD